MFKNMSREEHFSRAETSARSASAHGGASSLGLENQASPWISLLSVVSRPALSLLQRVLPGRSRTPALTDNVPGWAGGELQQNLVEAQTVFFGQLDDIMPDQHSTHHLAYLRESWLTDSLSELGIQNPDEANIKRRTPVGYFATARSFLSQVVLNASPVQEARQDDTAHVLGGHTWSAAVSSPAKSNWWGGFWGTEDNSQSWLSNLSWSREAPGVAAASALHSRDHCVRPEAGTKATVAKPTAPFACDAESMHGESAGPPCHKEERLDNGGLQTARPESLSTSQGLPLQHRPDVTISSLIVGAGAATACSEVAVLTPDQDNGYSSLEEEHSTYRLYMVNATCDDPQGPAEMTGDGASDEKRHEEERRGGDEKGAGKMDREEEEEEAEDSDVSDEEEEEEAVTSAREAPPPATPVCQNKAIAYIMGGPCSDDSQSDDSLDDEDDEEEEDDDGFDSEGSSDFSDSDDPDDDADSDQSDSDGADEEAERLWDSLCRSTDPYNPRNFTAPIQSAAAAVPRKTPSASACSPCSSPPDLPPSPLSSSASPPSPSPLLESWDESSASEVDEAESLRLWNSFSASSDPYSPLNFQGPLRTLVAPCSAAPRVRGKKGRTPLRSPRRGPAAPAVASSSSSSWRRTEEEAEAAEERLDSGFSESLTVALATNGTITAVATTTTTGCVTVKKVCFSEQVEEFYASGEEEEEDRRGPWEELARDRFRFLRRVQEVEENIGYVLAPAFRSLAYQRLQQPRPHHSS